jgi:carbamoyl-phosphate synthase large subunit
MKVLITQPNRKEHLIKAFEDAGAEVMYRSSGALPLTDDVDLIIPVNDDELEFFALAKEWFASKGIAVAANDIHAIRETRDKAEFNRFCHRHGFLTPNTIQENLVAKPRFGKGSRGVVKIDRSYILQEDLSELPEVSIDYFADAEGNTLSVIPRIRLDVVNGEATDAVFIEDMDLTEVTRLGKELMLVGHNVIQGFYTKTQFYFTEVNCRFGGGSWLTFEKFNSPKWLVDNYEQFGNKRRDAPLRS